MTYSLADEPKPSGLQHLTVQPFWPLFGSMLAPTVLAWGWFVLNGFAMGSPTRRREAIWAAAGIAAGYLILVAILAAEPIVGDRLGYAFLVLVGWKLLVSYRLTMLQSRVFELYTYFGGVARSGGPVVLVGYFARRALLDGLPDDVILWILPII